MKVSDIYRALLDKCENEGRPVLFNKKDVENKIPKGRNNALDCSDAIRHLTERHKKDPGLAFEYYLEEDGCLTRVFVIMEGAHDAWANLGSDAILLDTKHGTNRYAHKLGCFCTVDNNGKTRVIAGVFLAHEDEESFVWAFECFNEYFSAP